jgi:hypothetical protein
MNVATQNVSKNLELIAQQALQKIVGAERVDYAVWFSSAPIQTGPNPEDQGMQVLGMITMWLANPIQSDLPIEATLAVQNPNRATIEGVEPSFRQIWEQMLNARSQLLALPLSNGGPVQAPEGLLPPGA